MLLLTQNHFNCNNVILHCIIPFKSLLHVLRITAWSLKSPTLNMTPYMMIWRAESDDGENVRQDVIGVQLWRCGWRQASSRSSSSSSNRRQIHVRSARQSSRSLSCAVWCSRKTHANILDAAAAKSPTDIATSQSRWTYHLLFLEPESAPALVPDF